METVRRNSCFKKNVKETPFDIETLEYQFVLPPFVFSVSNGGKHKSRIIIFIRHLTDFSFCNISIKPLADSVPFLGSLLSYASCLFVRLVCLSWIPDCFVLFQVIMREKANEKEKKRKSKT